MMPKAAVKSGAMVPVEIGVGRSGPIYRDCVRVRRTVWLYGAVSRETLRPVIAPLR